MKRGVSREAKGVLSKRRFAGFLLCAMLFAHWVSAEAQQPQRIYKIGRLGAGAASDPLSETVLAAFQQGLRDLGWFEGKNIVVEKRWVRDDPGMARRLAAELVRLKVDVIVAVGSPLVLAAKQATTEIPIIMSGSGADPVTAGFVSSLQRPGGNITGLSMLSAELSGKRLELLKEMLVKPTRLAILNNPDFPAVAIQTKETAAAATALDLQLQTWEVRSAKQIPLALAAMKKAKMNGLIVFSDPVLLERHRRAIISSAGDHRIPTLYPWRRYVEEGGLASYSGDVLEMHRRAATYVDRILRGAQAAELPVEQPTKFEFVINLKTAQQMGLTIPANLLARADRVIR